MQRRPRALRLGACTVALAGLVACGSERDFNAGPSYDTDVGPLLQQRCAACHTKKPRGLAFDATSYLGTIGCTTDGRALTGPGVPLLAALARPDHQGLLAPGEFSMVERWVQANAPSTKGNVHPARFSDPRSPDGHAALLRARRYEAMLDDKSPDACGACHAGAPLPPKRGLPAAGAPACTSCHGETGGVLSCNTCHGSDAAGHPGQATCYRPAGPNPNVHARHLQSGGVASRGLDCTGCHPTPTVADFTKTHANGQVDVWFDHSVAGARATYDPATKQCAGTCHDRAGDRPRPSWTDTGTSCNSCHASPPASHVDRYRGACTSCHRDVAPDGKSLLRPDLHANGRVDLGDGSGKCGACHGAGEDPWPKTGAHLAHAQPRSAMPVPCETCHTLPNATAHPSGRGSALVRLGGLAIKGGARPSYNESDKRCAETYCHTGRGASDPSPAWFGSPKLSCGACHASPPPAPHSPSTACAGATCHQGSITETGAFTDAGAARHVDGLVTRQLP